MKKGMIFDIKEFAVFDGPGMRQTVFFKGCPLKCAWCHNPEGMSVNPELMVSLASCTRCGKCGEVCRLGIKPESNDESLMQNSGKSCGRQRDKNEVCTACGRCVPVCPLHLRRICGEKVTSEELAARIRKNSAYYADYGGGVTFSGGEPLMQAEFLIEVLEHLTDLHRAIETSGFCEPGRFLEVVSHLDYIIMDIKIFDSTRHRTYTGVDNRQILENAKQLCVGSTPFMIRIPLIPGVNDDEDNFRHTADWLAGSQMLEKVELLPYHRTAGAKYEMLGRDYKPKFDTEKPVSIPQGIFEQYGIRCEVG